MLLLVFFAFLGDNLPSLLLSIAALSLHELCHALMAKALGYRISSIELEPFGFIARLEKNIADRWDELLIASSGPLFSLVAGTAFLALKGQFGGDFHYFEEFGRINLWIAVVNLIPALPLDGGRAAKAALSGLLQEKSSIKLLCSIGAGVGLLLGALFAWMLIEGQWNITFLIWGVFLPLAAWREWRTQKGYRVSAMLRRTSAMRSGSAVPVRHTAVHGSLPAKEALKLFGDGRYTVLYVVDDEAKKLGELNEASLLNGIAEKGQEAALCDLFGPLR